MKVIGTLVSNHKKNINAIWHIKAANGEKVYSTYEIQREVVSFFEDFFKPRVGVNIVDQIFGTEDYPSMFNEELNESLFCPITLEDVHLVLKTFVKDKCPSLDGYTVELFLHFFFI